MTCRICYEDEGQTHKVCNCASEVHLECLAEWIRVRPPPKLTCEICHENYDKFIVISVSRPKNDVSNHFHIAALFLMVIRYCIVHNFHMYQAIVLWVIHEIVVCHGLVYAVMRNWHNGILAVMSWSLFYILTTATAALVPNTVTTRNIYAYSIIIDIVILVAYMFAAILQPLPAPDATGAEVRNPAHADFNTR